MKKTIIVLLLTVFGVCFAYPKHISVKQRELAFQHGRARMPSLTRVEADYEEGSMTVNFVGYTGSVQAFISDSNGQVVGYTLASIFVNGTVNINFNANSGECYSLSIILDNATYYGQFYS